MKIAIVLFCYLLSYEAESQTAREAPSYYIVIHRKSLRLNFFQDDSLLFTFKVRVGKLETPTPLGDGYVYIKRKRPVFRYTDPGPKQGQIVDTTECAGGKKKVDYKKMRALGLHYETIVVSEKVIKKLRLQRVGEERYSIHTVICEETIGHAISDGCIGVLIEDMFKIYDLVEVGPTGTRFLVLDD